MSVHTPELIVGALSSTGSSTVFSLGPTNLTDISSGSIVQSTKLALPSASGAFAWRSGGATHRARLIDTVTIREGTQPANPLVLAVWGALAQKLAA